MSILDRIIMWLFNLKDMVSFNMSGAIGEHLRYGQIKGHQVNVGNNEWVASQVVGNQSGKFVYHVAGALTLCVDSVAQIYGWAQERARTPTAGDTCVVNVALDAVYRIPVNSGTYAKGMIGDMCDISVSSDVQGAQLNASSENLLLVVGGDATNNNWVDVKINPVVQGASTGVEA